MLCGDAYLCPRQPSWALLLVLLLIAAGMVLVWWLDARQLVLWLPGRRA